MYINEAGLGSIMVKRDVLVEQDKLD